MMWFTDILRSLFTFLDRIVYGLITTLYQLLLYLANLDLFGMSTLTSTTDSSNVIVEFSSRVYALLGIFMLFKVSFSILQYMVNPDEFSDKSKGFGKMVTNILVSLCLIVVLPYIFQFAFRVQGAILESNFLGHLILGNTVSDENIDDADMSVNEEMAEDLQFLVYGSFFSVDTNVIKSCTNGPVLGTKAMARERDCLDDLAEAFEDVGGANKLGDFFAAGGSDSLERRFDAFGEVVNIKKDGQYVFNYMSLISTIAGGFIAIMLLSFCLDVAVRIIKLGFLEIIAPIPIISYMDPKQSGKDGMLGRWASECLRTYLSLFIRIAIIYFAFFVIDLVANEVLATDASDQLYLNGAAPTGLMAIFVRVMVIIGVFFFAKEVPKLLENLIPGMKGAGDLHFDRIKGMSKAAIGGSAVVGGIALGGIGNTIANMQKNRDLDEKLREGKISLEDYNKQHRGTANLVGSAIAGAISGGARSMVVGAKTGNPFKGVLGGVKASSDARRSRRAGYGFFQKAQDVFNEVIGLESDTGTTDKVKNELKLLRQRLSNAQRDESAASYQMTNLLSRNPNVAKSIRDAFAEDDDGNLKYNNYDQYLGQFFTDYGQETGDTTAKDLYDEVHGRLKEKQANGESIEQEQRELDALASQFDRVLSRDEYLNYRDARQARNDADDLSKSIEKEISRLEETQNYKGHYEGK